MDIGGWDTVLQKAEHDQLFYNQQATMEAPEVEQPDEIDDVVIPIKKPEPVTPKLKTAYVTGQYGIKPTASMVAEKPATYGGRATGSSYGTYPYGQKLAAQQPEKKEKPQLDLSGVAEGTTIFHKFFGADAVTNLDKKQKHIRVKFAVGDKTFIFPDSFKNEFLRTEKE